MAGPDGTVDTAAMLRYLACIAGWLISGFPEPDRKEELAHYYAQIKIWVDDNDLGAFAEILRNSLH